MIFDQYSRYKACADLLQQTDFVAGNSVLDIGSGPECLFGQFMPDATMNYVDPLIETDSEKGYITGNVFSSELDGRTFDCVTSVDVLEHVPSEHRQDFLQRMSLLASNTIVLGFPTSDSSAAEDVDKELEANYREIYGKDYSWLEEHHEYGLPSLDDTVTQLQQLGWHCQTVAHGYSPWLKELLSFVIAVWEVPGLKDIILDVSEKFNQRLYQYDYGTPCYRQFIIASRSELPVIGSPVGAHDNVAAQDEFCELLEDAKKQYFIQSLRLLSEQSTALAERDALVTELDAVLAERDAVVASVKEIKDSKSWRITSPLRFAGRLYRHGLINEDRQRISQTIRSRYHRLPVPEPVKKLLSFAYHKVLVKSIRMIRRRLFRVAMFHAPRFFPVEQKVGLPDYVVWGVVDWHFRHQRPQQLARALAGTGRRVFYISPKLLDDERAGFEVEALDDTGLLFQINLFVKDAPEIYTSIPGLETVAQLRLSVGELLDWAGCWQIVSLVQHPYWFDVASVLPNSRLVYDCMDHHEGFGNTAGALLQQEKALLVQADLTITTSSWLDQAVASDARRRVLIRNAAEYAFFSQQPENIYSDPQGRRIIGYYGAIAEWFDLKLVEAVAEQHPECCILLIGADTVNARGRLDKLHNVTFTGEVAYSEIPYYLYSFDICLLPFKVTPLTVATNPVKAYEYLSAGKPIIAVDLPEMSQFDGLINIAADKKQFLAEVDAVLMQAETEDMIQNRKTFAAGQTWVHRTEALIEHAERTDIDPMVSVVVVTYNNLELTRACLISLDENSQYANLEIIVVDNASSDESPVFLQAWVSNKHNRKLILNEDNRGFAAANNQGLAIASGDYLVMLNNDTYVTPGWIRTLSRHLQGDKTLGLIGPVTNNIGNEAKIDIAYKDMNDMLVKSAAYTNRHVGEVYPLRTAAFFCVMMSRETYAAVGPLDEVFGRGFFEDDDYCRRIEAQGLRVVCAEDVFIHHELSASFNKLKQKDRQQLFEENKKVYEAKWGEWIPHGYRKMQRPALPVSAIPYEFDNQKHVTGQCVVCGKPGRFFYQEVALWRETLNCEHCRTTSRYRSITRGILRAINELTGVEASSLANLPQVSSRTLHVYDTQPPFYYETCAYPLPDLLKATGWIDVELSQYKPTLPMGKVLAKGVTNQNLECLTFDDASLDLVITSDVMEHVRLDDRAHREIFRVLKPGGVYIFTVPHSRDMDETLIRVQITDAEDPSKDVHLLEPEYHGDTNSDENNGVLSYRVYGRNIEAYLSELGFEVEYFNDDIEDMGILNTELFYCRKAAG